MNKRPEKMFVYNDFALEEKEAVYTTADYARNGMLDVFIREGKHSEVKAILEQMGPEDIDSSMDPMEIMIRDEEKANDA